MTEGISLEALLEWNLETSNFWKAHLDSHPGLLELPCTIGGAATVQDLVRHIWGVELRWSQRIAGLPETPREALPRSPLCALFEFHLEAMRIFSGLLADPAMDWNRIMPLNFDWLPPQSRAASARKVAAHMLLHAQRHWAQLATLVRDAGHSSGFKGDFLFSASLA